jgi:hypothetical protein
MGEQDDKSNDTGQRDQISKTEDREQEDRNAKQEDRRAGGSQVRTGGQEGRRITSQNRRTGRAGGSLVKTNLAGSPPGLTLVSQRDVRSSAGECQSVAAAQDPAGVFVRRAA